MSTTQPCIIYKSITLAEGEQFVLPPGAEIVSVSAGLDSFTTTCEKPTSLEVPVEYEFIWAGAQDTNDATKLFESEGDINNYMTGIFVNNNYHVFSSFLGDMAADTNLQGRFDSTPFNSIITNARRTYYDNDESNKNRGMGAKYRFVTIPSIGDNIEIAFSTGFISDRFGDLFGSSFNYRTKPYKV